MVAINNHNTAPPDVSQHRTELAHLLHQLMRPLVQTFGTPTATLTPDDATATIPADVLPELLAAYVGVYEYITRGVSFNDAQQRMMTIAPRVHKYEPGWGVTFLGNKATIVAQDGYTKLSKEPAYVVRAGYHEWRGVAQGMLSEPKPPDEGLGDSKQGSAVGNSPKSKPQNPDQAAVPLPVSAPAFHETPPDRGCCDVGGWVFLPPMMAPMRWPGPGGRCIH